ncbi:MAG TPA: DUF6599 family protein [Acidobacteriaceae bacterium]|jgi:hypothetical protein|nr:DUF6599 family protein [Acidobacteriaceae bacterium]
MHRIPVLAIFPTFVFCSTLAFAAPAPSGALLPHAFAGWTATGVSETVAAAGPDAAVLAEYGLQQTVSASYVSGAHRLTVRAWRFPDATGAFGAFTFFRQPAMHAEALGAGGAVSGDRALFWSGTTVIDATFARPVAKENAILSALAGELPKAVGTQGVAPSLPDYLPKAQLNAESVHYAIGPAGWARLGSAVPAGAVDFSQDAEAVTAQYGAATLALIMYPTPQIAGAHLKTIDALPKSLGLTAGRTGPLLAIASGVPRAQAVPLLRQVKFNDYVTINHPEGYIPETVKLYRLVFGITMLVVILVSAAVLLGLFLGGGRALYRRLRGKPASVLSDEEFISLHLGG